MGAIPGTPKGAARMAISKARLSRGVPSVPSLFPEQGSAFLTFPVLPVSGVDHEKRCSRGFLNYSLTGNTGNIGNRFESKLVEPLRGAEQARNTGNERTDGCPLARSRASALEPFSTPILGMDAAVDTS